MANDHHTFHVVQDEHNLGWWVVDEDECVEHLIAFDSEVEARDFLTECEHKQEAYFADLARCPS